MNKFYSTSIEEQETIINIDYAQKEVNLYTTRNAQYNRLNKKLGEPTKVYYTNKKISGVIYKRNVDDKFQQFFQERY